MKRFTLFLFLPLLWITGGSNLVLNPSSGSGSTLKKGPGVQPENIVVDGYNPADRLATLKMDPRRELIEKRSRTAKHYRKEDGKTIDAVISPASLHYQSEDGNWLDIDLSLSNSPDPAYRYANTSNNLQSWFPANLAEKGVRLQTERGQFEMGSRQKMNFMDEEGKAIDSKSIAGTAPSIRENKITYGEAFANIDNEYVIEADKVKHNFLIRQRPDFPAGTSRLSFSEEITLPDNWKMDFGPDKQGLVILNEKDEVYLEIPAPAIYEKDNPELTAGDLFSGYELTPLGRNTYQVQTYLSVEWLSERNYPLVVDPTVVLNGNFSGYILYYYYQSIDRSCGSLNGTFYSNTYYYSYNNTNAVIALNEDSYNYNCFSCIFQGTLCDEYRHKYFYKGWIRYYTGSIPDDAQINSVEFSANVSGGYIGSLPTQIFSSNSNGSSYYSANFSGFYDDITYYSHTTTSYAGTGQYPFLGLNPTRLKEKLPVNYFQVGLYNSTVTTGNSQVKQFGTSASLLRVTYTCNVQITCPANITVNSAPDVCGAVVNYSAPVGTSACSLPTTTTLTAGLSSGSTFPTGTTTQTYTVTDAEYGVAPASCSFTVTVTEDVAPVIDCSSIPNTFANTEPGSCSATVAVPTPSVSDNCSQTITLTNNWTNTSDASGVYPIDWTYLYWTATDEFGNSSNCYTFVRVIDNEQPSINCPADISVSMAPGACTAAVTVPPPTVSDNCGVILSNDFNGQSNASGSYPSGTKTITWTVKDNANNTATCSHAVTVLDNTPPSISCSAPITVSVDPGSCNATVAVPSPGISGSCNYYYQTTPIQTHTTSGQTFTFTFNATPANATGNATLTVYTRGQVHGYPIPSYSYNISLESGGGFSIFNPSSCGSSFGYTQVSYPASTINSWAADGSITLTANTNGSPIHYFYCLFNDIYMTLSYPGSTVLLNNDFNNTADAFDTYPLGTTNVLWTATNSSGVSSNCTQVVTVVDDEAPSISCPADITVDNAGQCSAIVSYAVPEGTDNCTGATTVQTAGLGSGATFPVGATTETYTVTDAAGLSANCSFTVTVVQEPPVAICQDITVQLGADGTASITPGDVDNGSNAACGMLNLNLNLNTFGCGNVGSNSVTLTVTDNNNSSTCSATVTVEDMVAPAAVCQDITIDLDDMGNAAIAEDAVNIGSNDACGGLSFDTDITNFSCSELGDNAVVLTVTDANNNSSTCAATVTVRDVTPPIALCQNITVELDASGQASIPGDALNNGSYDVCGGNLSFVIDYPGFSCGSVGSDQFEMTVTDARGNSSTCSAIVTVRDATAPAAVCQDITVQLDASGQAAITENAVNNGSTDACGGLSFDTDITSFSCNEVGGNAVVLTVTDTYSNSSTCSATVTVQDNVAPAAICQDITVQLDAGGNASITTGDIDNGSNDACGILSLSLNLNSFGCGDIGSNSVILTVTDNNNNTATCSAIVTVEDNVGPVALCQDLTVQLNADGEASITANEVNNGSNDACGIQSAVLSQQSFSCDNVGPVNFVTLTVTDVNGNTAECEASVIVVDNIAPTAICKDITVQLDETGSVYISNNSVDNGSNDACGLQQGPSFAIAFLCADVGDNPVTYTVTDVNGNTASCTATVTVQDVSPPVAICQDITIELDASGQATIPGDALNDGSYDVCGGNLSFATDYPGFNCGSVGSDQFEMTVTDARGNSSTCSAIVTVRDATAPAAVCQDITVQLDASGQAAIAENAVNNGSSDACGGLSFDTDITSFSCNEVGGNAVVLIVTDTYSNSSTCSATVTVQDNVAPAAICQDIIVQLDASGNASITTGDIDNGSNDACGILNLSLNLNSFGCGDIGSNSVILTVTDNNNNTATCSAIVTVEDNVGPVALCQDLTVQLNADGEASITANEVNNGSNDACGIQSAVLSQQSFSCDNVGPVNFVTLTVTDVNGNTAECEASVIVVDNIAPAAICKDITVQLDETGSVYISNNSVDNGSNDACGLQQGSSFAIAFFCADVGDNPVTYTVTDMNGNTASCTATVTVADDAQYCNQPPVAVCQNITVSADGNCQNTATVATDFDGGSSDPDEGDVLSFSVSPAGPYPLGATNVTLTVSDLLGASSTCAATITVVDDTPPTITCPADITVNTDAGLCGAVVSYTVPVGEDNCAGATTAPTAGLGTGATFPAGTTTEAFSVTDGAGFQASCSFTVTVNDSEPPVAACNDITVLIGQDGTYELTTADIDAIGAGSTDNCGVDNLAASQNSFTGVGTYPLTLTVTDVNTNSSTCGATLTIEKRPTTLVYTGDSEVQYSDQVTLSAQLTDDDSGTGIGGQTITFTIGTQSATAVTNANGIAETVLVITQPPSSGCASDLSNTYDVDVTYGGSTVYLAGSGLDNPFGITQEDARITYTGPLFISTSGPNNSNATVLLSVTIQDIAVTADAGSDGDEGNIGYATVDFINRDGGVINTTPIPVIPIDPNDPTTGVAIYNWNVDIGNNNDSEQYGIGVRVCGRYTRDEVDDDVVVTVSKPLNNFVTGGGYIILENPAGPLAGDVGSRNNFGFNIRPNNAGTNLKGKIRVLVRRTEADGLHVYQIKGNQMTSLAVDPDTDHAIFFGKANVQDVTDPDNPVSVVGNGTFEVIMTDNGEPGTQDLIGINLWDNNGGLRFSSNWNGAQTLEQNLAGGNLVVHYGNGNLVAPTNTSQKTITQLQQKEESLVPDIGEADFTLFPNPTRNEIFVGLDAFLGQSVKLIIYDNLGRIVRVIPIDEVQTPTQRIDVGRLGYGVYRIQVRTDKEALVKQFVILE